MDQALKKGVFPATETKKAPPSNTSENGTGEVWLSRDELDMARMGKKQELKRSFSWISSVGFTSCTMGT